MKEFKNPAPGHGRVSEADKKMLRLSALAVAVTAGVILLGADAAEEVASEKVPSEYVWVDTEYCIPADGGLLCEVDPYSLHEETVR